MRILQRLAFVGIIVSAPAAWAEVSWYDANIALFDCRSGDEEACEIVATSGRLVAGDLYEDADMATLSPATYAKIPDLIASRRAACAAGDQATCVEIANLSYLFSPEKPPMESFDLYARACDQGNTTACFSLTSIAEWSNAQEDQTAAVAYYETQVAACADGDRTACVNQARLNTRLRDIVPDQDIWRTQFEKACDARHARACQYLGNAYGYWGGAEYSVLTTEFSAIFRDNFEVALAYNKKACDLGSSAGCWDVASAYRLGDGIAEDVERGIAYDLRSCVMGAINACFNIEYDWAYTVEVDDETLQSTCAEGFAHACYLLTKERTVSAAERMAAYIDFCKSGASAACVDGAGLLREAGQSDKAAPLAFIGCHNGNADGCAVLGDIFMQDKGTSEDQVIAREHYKGACRQNSVQGCMRLAEAFEQGLGGPEDKDYARDIYYDVCYGYEESETTAEACRRADAL